MEQLKMMRDDTKIGAIHLPEGFLIRSYKKGDEIGWCRCCINGSLGVDEISEEVFEKKMLCDENVNPNNIFLLISPSNEIAGTATYQYTSEKEVAYLHMVGIAKNYQGKRLALPINLYAIQKMLEDGKKRIYLTTDDWRLPAIKTYYNAGFNPVFYQPDMEERWKRVMEKLLCQSRK